MWRFTARCYLLEEMTSVTERSEREVKYFSSLFAYRLNVCWNVKSGLVVV